MEISILNLKSLKANEIADGEEVDVMYKDLGTADIYP